MLGPKRMDSGRWLSRLVRSAMAFVALTVLLVSSYAAQAQQDDDDESSVSAPTGAPDKARRRLYLGGRDEEDLTVQASLPQPVRSPDAVPGVSAEESAHD